ncbi:phosphatase PAP2 family protein [Cellulosimicrobium protaetiae]|uniref:Phosphatase PAP2 family protein n=1 Tax=Cellulosimicrobium protaetiae TaxID=2587808 RepID=A0A6M5UFA5_9MICO|nr:phosphatase PAP2 family protein [Cellulosimicrobium protaetiae]QJW35991.1 phosphatase PAP2 family protein [Cellulosimicrobium protaetiae]
MGERPRAAATLILLLVLAFVALWAASHLTAAGQQADAGVFRTVAPLHDVGLGTAGALRRGLPVVCAGVVAVLGVVAIVRRAWRDLVAALLVVLGTVGIALGLRAVLVRPDLGGFGYAHQTFPSGHVAVVGGLCVAIWLLWPWPASRSLAGWVGLGATAVAAFASVVTYAHRPSDVVGSLLVAAAVAIAVAWLLDVPRAVSPGDGSPSTPPDDDPVPVAGQPPDDDVAPPAPPAAPRPA